jgi:adenine deaminase
MTGTKLQKLIKAARGEIPADLVLKGGRVVNVFSCEITETDLAVCDDTIVGLGRYEGREIIDCRRRVLCPGFIEGHIHIESSMLVPHHLAPVLLPLGTTTLIADPHEIANVFGLKGIQFLLDDSVRLPLEIYLLAPSCVPATDLETAGAELTAKDLRPLRRNRRILGLAEVMNFPGVLEGRPDLIKKIAAFKKKVIDGHAPLLTGKDLCAYIAAGMRSDHETTRIDEAREKLALGMRVMIREGSQAKNLSDLRRLVTDCNARRCLLVSDDRHPEDLQQEGHLNFIVKKAIDLGIDPVSAIQMVTLNPAEHFGLSHLGALAPGYQADIVILDSLSGLDIEAVIKRGRLVARRGKFLAENPKPVKRSPGRSMNLKGFTWERLRIPIQGRQARVIGLIPGQILTRQEQLPVSGKKGFIDLAKEEDVIQIASVERHRATGNIGLGLVRGFGLKQGALASSVAHDSHNILVIGRDPKEMFLAVQAVVEMGGGQAAVLGNRVLGKLPLPVAGLMSDQGLDRVLEQQEALLMAASLTGCASTNPFMALAFLALPVIPELRITDKGLVDVNRFELVPLFYNV